MTQYVVFFQTVDAVNPLSWRRLLEMKSIPVHSLEAFEEFYMDSSSRSPARHQAQVNSGAHSYFSIFLRDEHPCKAEIDVNRSEFYKILLITRGSGVLTYGNREYEITSPAILFLKPTEVKSWSATTKEQSGYYCIFNEQFHSISHDHLSDLRSGGLFGIDVPPAHRLTEVDLEILAPVFEKLLHEFNAGAGLYSERILRMYLHVLLLESGRISGEATAQARSCSANLTERFLKLLDMEFANGSAARLRFPVDFADRLAVHKNHLNALVKTETGKTVGEHIHDRLAAEAQLLLQHSDLNVSEIACRLGYKETAHFCNFFKKRLKITPVEYRRVMSSAEQLSFL